MSNFELEFTICEFVVSTKIDSDFKRLHSVFDFRSRHGSSNYANGRLIGSHSFTKWSCSSVFRIPMIQRVTVEWTLGLNSLKSCKKLKVFSKQVQLFIEDYDE